MEFTVRRCVITAPQNLAGVKLPFCIEEEKVDTFDDNRLGMEQSDAEGRINDHIQRHSQAAFDAGVKWARENPDK